MTLLEQVEAMLQTVIDERVASDTAGLRDQLMDARRELADARLFGDAVADERDAVIARVQELELRLLEVRNLVATPAPEPAEVNGFCVGDLVSAHGCTPEPIARFTFGSAHLDGAGLAVPPDRLTRKPVAVGDTVRARWCRRATVTQGPDRNGRIIVEEDGMTYSAPLCTCVAIDPTVAP